MPIEVRFPCGGGRNHGWPHLNGGENCPQLPRSSSLARAGEEFSIPLKMEGRRFPFLMEGEPSGIVGSTECSSFDPAEYRQRIAAGRPSHNHA